MNGKAILTHCFGHLVKLSTEELVAVIDYLKNSIKYHGNEYDGVPVTHTHQRGQKGLARALLNVEEYINNDLTPMLGGDIF